MMDYFFSFRGRIPRKHYWLATLAIIALIAVAMGIGYGLLQTGLNMFVAFAVPGILILIAVVASFAVGVRRLHDRGKSWRWLIPFYILPNFLDPERLGAAANTPAFWLITALSFGLSMWGLVELGFLKGNAGTNEYGEDPLNPMPNAEVFE
ncbi:MAG: DUF805 domain-containing protein [Pseudomonadota bacterium]